MTTERITNLFKLQGHEHLVWKRSSTKIYTDTPKRTLEFLRRAVETDDQKATISINLPEIGEVVDVPFIQLSPKTILLIGSTWTATLEESEAADESNP